MTAPCSPHGEQQPALPGVHGCRVIKESLAKQVYDAGVCLYGNKESGVEIFRNLYMKKYIINPNENAACLERHYLYSRSRKALRKYQNVSDGAAWREQSLEVRSRSPLFPSVPPPPGRLHVLVHSFQ